METMSSVTITVSDPEEITSRFLAAFRGEPQGARIAFVSAEHLLGVLTPSRWRIIQAMAGQGAMSIRRVGQLVGRDHRGVQADVKILLQAGVLDQVDEGVVFPYAEAKLEMAIKAGAVPSVGPAPKRRRPGGSRIERPTAA